MINDIVQGLTIFFNNSAFTILSTIGNLLAYVINIILLPLNLIFSTFFPDFTNGITIFKNYIIYISSIPLDFFIKLIPPLTLSMILFYLSIRIAYYFLIYSYKATTVVPVIIRKIKFW